MSLFKSPNLIKTRAKKRVGFGGFRRGCLTRFVALVLMSYKTRTINYGFLNEGFKNFLESKQLKIGEDLTENSIERRKERLGKPADHNLNYLRDKELANEWRDFHGKNANLKPQSAKENLTQKKQKVDMKPVIAPHLWK